MKKWTKINLNRVCEWKVLHYKHIWTWKYKSDLIDFRILLNNFSLMVGFSAGMLQGKNIFIENITSWWTEWIKEVSAPNHRSQRLTFPFTRSYGNSNRDVYARRDPNRSENRISKHTGEDGYWLVWKGKPASSIVNNSEKRPTWSESISH